MSDVGLTNSGRRWARRLGVGLVVATVWTAEAARSELDLGGSWQYQKVSQLLYPPTNTWQTMTVPGFLSGYQYERAWFRRTFTIPSAMAGSWLKLRFGGVKYNAQVWLNGVYVGGYLNGYEPFELDITSAARVGQTNELIVGVTDWTATFEGTVDFTALPAGQNARDFVKNTIIAPIGGRYEQYGIWQPVKLLSTPAVSIADVFVMPSVRTQQLSVRLMLRNDSAATQTVNVTNRVLDGANTVLTLPHRQLVIAPGATSQLDIAAPWPDARRWSHLDPYLYHLETTVANGSDTDQIKTRFGFREFWAEGGRFFLNGTPINLLAAATWPPSDLRSSNQIRQVLLEVKAGNNTALRLHTQPWDKPWYEIADEVGLLIVEECAVWCDPAAYKLGSTNFWSNYAQHLAAAVKRDRNHPSIVLWSLENEILHCGGERLYAATESQLAAMGRVVKSLDPTRPITYEADLDPDGEAHVVGLHYPYEYPDYHVWPNAAWWMHQPIDRDWEPGGKWIWNRAKPLYIGEFLWVPSTSASDFTILFGEAAYGDRAYYRNLAKGLTWRMQIEAYRAYGVNGICPWTMFEDPAVAWGQFELFPESNHLYQVQKAAYHPNLVFAEEYNPRFFAGETATRTVHVFNDRMVGGNFTLRWNSGTGGWQSRAFALPPAGHWSNSIAFQVPATPGSFDLRYELSEGSGVVFTNTASFSAGPRITLTLPAGVKVGLYDPHGATAPLFNRFGLPFTLVTDLRVSAYDPFNLLVIGRHALTNEPVPEVGSGTLGAKWQDFARRGGWVLVLEQTNYPAWMPGELALRNFDASFAFPSPDHPVTADLTAEDLRWWAGDHRLVSRTVASPARGNFRVLAAVGSRNGLEHAAAVELPIGRGGLLASQWLLTERFDVEPLAGVLLQRLLDYCGPAIKRPDLRPVALLAETNSTAALKLTELGLLAENFSGRVTDCDPALYPLLVVAGSNTAWNEATARLATLTNFLGRGGTLLLHRPDSAFLAAARPVLFPELTPVDSVLGLVLRREASQAAVRLNNHDLYWVEQAGDWNRDELLSTNVARRFYRKQFDLVSYATIEVENMAHNGAGGASSGGWWHYANGSSATNITITQPGAYLFNVLARGTPAFGDWPVMTLKLDGRVVDHATVASNTLSWYTLSADLTPGTHQLALSFDNDAYNPPNEDRNLFLDKIRWGRDSDTSPATLLTSPGTVAQVRRGNGLLVLDEIAWESETKNATKANRFASRLLTDLGAACRSLPTLTIEAETMTNVNVAAYSTNGGLAHLNSGGRIETTVRFTTAGSYTFEVLAGGDAAAGVLPQIGITVNGASRTNFFLTTTNLSRYAVTLSMSTGTHRIGLAFLNDFYAPPEDRNARFDRLTITPPLPPRLTALRPDAAQAVATLQWEAAPGKTYDVLTATNPAVPGWQTAQTLGSAGTVASWQDAGGPWGAPPLSPAAPQRFYRVRQVGP